LACADCNKASAGEMDQTSPFQRLPKRDLGRSMRTVPPTAIGFVANRLAGGGKIVKQVS
jgi:hypothetical protein